MHDTDNRVSVIIAAFNAQDTIGRAIKSALSDEAVSEVIIIDDASTDDTVIIAKNSDDGTNRLKILSQDINLGPAAARNLAIKESSSKWISILDADDFLLPNRTTNLLSFSDGYDLVADDMYQVSQDDIDGKRTTLLHPPLKAAKEVSFYDFVMSNITKGKRNRAELGFIKPLIKRSSLIDNKISYKEHMRLGEDYEIYARLLGRSTKMILTPAQGYVSVVRPNSLSAMHSIDDLQHLRDCNITLLNDLDLGKKERRALKSHYRSIDCRYKWRLLIRAVKERHLLNAVSTFISPYPVPFYLLKQLVEQVYIRLLK